MSEDKKAAFKTALVDVAKEITEGEAKELAFECPKIPRADRDKIQSGVNLVERLETTRFVSLDNVDDFIDMLERRNLPTPSDILKEYKKNYIDKKITVPPQMDSEAATPPDSSQRITDSSRAAGSSALERMVDDDVLRIVSAKITRDWKDVGRILKVNEDKLDEIKHNNHGDIKETCLQMLRYWKSSNASGAVYRKLGEALEKAGRTDIKEEVYKEASQRLDGGQ